MAPTFDDIDRNIRTLTTLLHVHKQGDQPLSSQKAVPEHLLALAALLTRGSESDLDAKTVVAVTGSSKEGGFQAAVVAHNSLNNCEAPFSIDFKEIQRSPKSFEEITMTTHQTRQPPIEEYIAELITMFSGSPWDRAKETGLIAGFVTSRCISKLDWRLNADKLFWKGGLVGLLSNWRPTQSDEIEDFRCETPQWIREREPFKSAVTKRSITDHDGKNLILSATTARVWAGLLANLVSRLRSFCTAVKKEQNLEKRAFQLGLLVMELGNLQRFVRMRILAQLLNIKSLQGALDEKSKLLDPAQIQMPEFVIEDDTEANERQATMARSLHESAAGPVFRHLRNIISWISAVHLLAGEERYKQFFRSVSIGLVETSGARRGLLSIDEIKTELLKRGFYKRIPESFFEQFPRTFTGSIHAEATLMGLLQACALDGDYIAYDDVGVSNTISSEKGRLIRWMTSTFMLKDNPIAADKRCCWCCHNLAKLLKREMQLTHGNIYPWSPPRIGIPLEVLEKLETMLWDRFIEAVKTAHRSQSQHSSGLNSKRTSQDIDLENMDVMLGWYLSETVPNQ